MINSDKAFELIKRNISAIKKTTIIDIKNALGMILAEDVKSQINIPPENNSAVDGFAVNYNNYIKSTDCVYEVYSEINAGDYFNEKKINKNHCLKVSTGAHLPKFLDTVIMLEDVEIINKNIIRLPKTVDKKNVRKKGEDIQKGTVVLNKNITLRSQELGMLASINKKKVKVYEKVKVAIVSNGNELINPGKVKKNHQIYDSNRFMLMGLLNQASIDVIDEGITKDSYNAIKSKIVKFKRKYNLIVITGGASVGQKDYIIKIIMEIGKLVFSTVSIKPGRPLSFGLIEKKIPVLILPGNPVAAFVTFNIFGNYLINCLYGIRSKEPKFFNVKSNFKMKKKLGREEFLRGKVFIKKNILYVDKYITEGAGILSSVIWSEGLIRLKSNIKTVNINDDLEFIPYEQN